MQATTSTSYDWSITGINVKRNFCCGDYNAVWDITISLSTSSERKYWHRLVSSYCKHQGTKMADLTLRFEEKLPYDSLENPLYLYADDSTLCRTICHPSDRHAAASSLTADLGKITNWSNMWNMSFNPDKSHTLTVSPKGPFIKPPHPLSQQSSGRSPFFQASGSHYLP